MLWKVRLKGLGPVYEVLIEASEGKERAIAEAYAGRLNQRVIGEVVPAVVATEAILEEPVPAPVAPSEAVRATTAPVRPIQVAK